MSMNNEKIIQYDSPDAASIKTVTGWVSSRGYFFGNNEDMARYDGCTHRKCNTCDALIPINGPMTCGQCRETKEAENYKAMPCKPWDGERPLCSQSDDVFFLNLDELSCYREERGRTPQLLRLVICDPEYADEINANDYYSDKLPDGSDLPEEIVDAFDQLNEALRECQTPLSWSPGKFAPTEDSVLSKGVTK